MDEQPERQWSRRTFFSVTAGALTTGLIPLRAAAVLEPQRISSRVLSFFNTHTGERLSTAYRTGAGYEPAALAKIDVILRDFRTNAVRPIDPALLDLLHQLRRRLRTNQPFHVISGYRAPETNRMLRSRGGADSGVASHSLHTVGKAVDIRVPGTRLDVLREAARSLKLGGVGFYPRSNFVHVDTGRVRFW
jgi:uncharacterized protein YcbK (DUF882 family)